MSEGTEIEWCRNSDGSPGYTFNPWRGCTKVSAACRFCYAERDRSVRLHGIGWGPSAERRISAESTWAGPLAWNAKHHKAGTRGRVFCASLADVFEDRPELEAPRLRLLALIALTPSLDWLLLTKRPDVMARVMTSPGLYQQVLAAANRWRSEHPRRDLSRIPVSDPARGWHNLWAGTTAENQEAADERIPHLLRVPARVRFLSCEPLLGAVDLWGARYLDERDGGRCGAMSSWPPDGGIHWVIAGGESGPGARPSHPAWFRSLRDQCAAADVPFFFKQWGNWALAEGAPAQGDRILDRDGSSVLWRQGDTLHPGEALMRDVGKKAAGRLLAWREHNGMPEVSDG